MRLEYMKIIVGCVTAIVIIALSVILIFLSRRKALVTKIDRSMPQIQYLLFLVMPIASFTIVCECITINPLISSLLWILVILVMDKLLTRKMLLSTTAKAKVAMTFLSMLLCALYFITQGMAECSWKYVGMFSVAGSLVVGFFVPLDVILSDTYLKSKCTEIVKRIELKHLERTTIYFYIMILAFFESSVIIDNTKLGQMMKIPASIGAIAGFVISLVIISILFQGINNSIKDCTDYREGIFDSQLFLGYQYNIEDKLGLSHEELYDHVEAFLFYRAFSSKECNCAFISEMMEQKIYEAIQNNFVVFKNYRLVLKKKRYKYILKKGQKEYSYECLVNPWNIFLSYIQQFGAIQLEDDGISQENQSRYEMWGYVTEEEKWLLFFLEKYHALSRKGRKLVVPDELKSFVYYVYKEAALWIVPSRCITYMYYDKNLKKSDRYSSGDMTLPIIYEWFKRKKNRENTIMYLISVVEKETLVNAIESWLEEYTDWEEFVISNKLNKFVKRKLSWNTYGFAEPPKIFQHNLTSEDNEKARKEWLKAIKKTTNLFYYRY